MNNVWKECKDRALRVYVLVKAKLNWIDALGNNSKTNLNHTEMNIARQARYMETLIWDWFDGTLNVHVAISNEIDNWLLKGA